MALDSPEPALARWLAGGITSRTHPVLDHARRIYFLPLGIEAECLEAEIFSDLETGGGGWWLRSPRWNPNRFDRTAAAEPDFAYLLEHGGQFDPSVGPQGVLALSISSGSVQDAAAKAWFEKSESGWWAIRHTVRAARQAEAFIYAAAGSLLASSPAATLYAEGRVDEFCTAIAGCLKNTEIPPEPKAQAKTQCPVPAGSRPPRPSEARSRSARQNPPTSRRLEPAARPPR